jgi:hypothetical protein
MQGRIVIKANIRGGICAGDVSFVRNTSGCMFIYV